MRTVCYPSDYYFYVHDFVGGNEMFIGWKKDGTMCQWKNMWLLIHERPVKEVVGTGRLRTTFKVI
jgi:hypothetical protein